MDLGSRRGSQGEGTISQPSVKRKSHATLGRVPIQTVAAETTSCLLLSRCSPQGLIKKRSMNCALQIQRAINKNS